MRLNRASFKVISLLNSDKRGDTSWAIFWISSLVSAEFKLKKILEILSNCSPENSNASIVFSKVGCSAVVAIASISILAFSIAFLIAGRKSLLLIFEKGAVLYWVRYFFNNIFSI